jgi:hypothetical protein
MDVHTPNSHSGNPEILLLSLTDNRNLNDWLYLFEKLHGDFDIELASSADQAVKYLSTNKPKAIFITDEGLLKPEAKPVVKQIKAYLRTGGLVITGFQLANSSQEDTLGKFFKQVFDLSWRASYSSPASLHFNPDCVLPEGVEPDQMIEEIFMASRFVVGAKSHEKIYVAVPGRKLASMTGIYDHKAAAVVGADVFGGYVAYVGGFLEGMLWLMLYRHCVELNMIENHSSSHAV